MGFIDFVKSAGQKLGLVDEEPAAAPAVDTADIKRRDDRRRAMALVSIVQDLGLAVEDLSVRVDDDLVTVNGVAASQADREKVVLAVGNTDGIARVDDQMEVAGPKATYYTVVSGDSLSKIAKEQYGDPMKYPVIFEANRPMLEHPDKIYPGQVLRIPAQDG
jgi:nucleoid-associated protein YgaU